MRTHFAIVAGLFVIAFSGALGLAVASPSYSVTDLGNLGYSSYPASINSAGLIVGTSYADSAQTQSYAFLYDASSTGTKTMVALFGSGNYGNTANGINDSGQIVGSLVDAYTSSTGTVYQQDAYTASLSTGAVTPLSFSYNSSGAGINVGGGYSGSAASANAVNNNGVVAGTVVLPGDSSMTQYGFTYDPNSGGGNIFPDPSGVAGSGIVVSNNGINNSGIFVGTLAVSTATNAAHLAYYFNPADGYGTQIHTPLDTNGSNGVSYYAEANAINDAGQVVGGGVMSTTGNGTFHAYRYDIFGAGTMIDLGALATGDFSEAYGINSSGQIVGLSNISAGGSVDHAFLYNGGQMTDLNSLIPANSGWTLVDADAINAAGWIVGVGVNSAGAVDGFLLQPANANNPGNVNGDGRVNVNDLTIVLTNFGSTGNSWSQGNMDGDPTGTVDVNDLTIILSNFGNTYTAHVLAAVPEPSSFAMLAVAILVPAAGWRIAPADGPVTAGCRRAEGA